MKVLVYVEGPSDRSALEALLDTLMERARTNGIGIRFLPLQNKSAILNDSGRKAADHLADNPEDWVFALPDLYPMSAYDGTDNEHHSFPDLERLLTDRFTARANKLGLGTEERRHFRVHCLKHDLEVLLLADPQALRERLGTTNALRKRWRNPVEDQDDYHPPKHIVEELFRRYRKQPGYVDTEDAPWIMRHASLQTITTACPQRFGPFLRELQALAETGVL